MRLRDPLNDEQRQELDALDRALAGEPVAARSCDLEALVHDIRATAPEMPPDFAARLEQELQEGFPASRERPVRPMLASLHVHRPGGATSRRRRAQWFILPAAGSLAAVLVALVVVLGANSETSTTFSGEATPPAERDSTAEPSGSAGAGADGEAEDRAASGAPPIAPVQPAPSTGAIAPGRERQVERSAVLALRTPQDRFERTTDAVVATMSRFGGIVASSQIGASAAAGGEAFFDLRIPTQRLDRALAALSRLGHVTERSQSLQDITTAFSSTRKRLTDARAERSGLLRALKRATSQERIDSLKTRLRAVSSRIAARERELSSLRRRAELSRVDLTVRAQVQTGGATGGSWTPGDAAGDALRVLEVLAGVGLVALAVLAPLALLGLAIALAFRAGRRRRRESALDPA